MGDEMVDIIDEENRVTGTVLKSEAHKKGLLHQTVISEIINPKGEWTLVRQSSSRQDAGQYVSPVGGHVQAGESLEEALRREAYEECGLKDFSFQYKGKCIYNRNVLRRQENHYFMIFEIHSDEPIILNHESDEFKTFETEELKRLLIEKPQIFGDAFFPVIECCYPELLGKG